MLRPALPNVFTASNCHAGVSFDPHFRRVRPSASSVHGLNHRSALGLTRQSLITLGRSEPPPVLLSSRPENTVKGRPLCRVRMPVSCHPPSTARAAEFASRFPRRPYTPLKTQRKRTS